MKRPGWVELIRQFALAVVAFEVVVIGGTALFMAIGMLVGYLPYSDRPGPGWYGPAETIRALPVVADWIGLNWWGPPFYGAAVFIIVKVVSLVPRVPIGIVRAVGAVLTAFVGALWVAAAGWVLALALSVQWAALVAGAVYGVWVLPRIIRRVPTPTRV